MGIPLPPILGGGQDLYAYEQALRVHGIAAVAGADEAGRGACAGPLVAGAVILPPDLRPAGLNDSKLMTPAARDRVYEQLVAGAVWAVSVVPAAQVDRVGVQQANYAALRDAVAGLSARPGLVLFDGFAVPGVAVPSRAVVKGDRLAACIAAASVIAKVTRDRIMVQLHQCHPVYGFAAHKGYSTAAHQAALDEHGPCPEHRRSYVNVAAASVRKAPEGTVLRQGTVAAIVGQNEEGSAQAAQGDLLDFGVVAEDRSRARLDL
ncbi:ribonuclease HII [Actinocrinis puniceicyclus]|uniref:Ribonuclease HII n=1 Tax=Actinocrinis puniceicyclus TaxID=977794 RepID=A0A8J7WL30_9ACTN|nr:ribonuclease HII [Actinocrinis puniceicyclus]